MLLGGIQVSVQDETQRCQGGRSCPLTQFQLLISQVIFPKVLAWIFQGLTLLTQPAQPGIQYLGFSLVGGVSGCLTADEIKPVQPGTTQLSLVPSNILLYYIGMCFWWCCKGNQPSQDQVVSETVNYEEMNQDNLPSQDLRQGYVQPLQEKPKIQTFFQLDDRKQEVILPQPQNQYPLIKMPIQQNIRHQPQPVPTQPHKKVLLAPPEDFNPDEFKYQSQPEEEKKQDPSPIVPIVEQKPKKKKKPNPFDNRPRLNPQDYAFRGKLNEILIKKMGSIDGEQFSIDSCKDCSIMLFDHLQGSYVDDSERCLIFVGPSASSVFVRNCKECTVIAICNQFRVRDCEDCHFYLLVQSQPVIESSTKLQIHCILNECFIDVIPLMKKAGLNPYNNFWSQVHDFSAKGSQSKSFITQLKPYGYDLKKYYKEAGYDFIQDIFLQLNGITSIKSQNYSIIVFNQKLSERFGELIHILNNHDFLEPCKIYCGELAARVRETVKGEGYEGRLVCLKVGSVAPEENIKQALEECEGEYWILDCTVENESLIFPVWKDSREQ